MSAPVTALLPIGTRVRHVGERFWQALEGGTANIVGYATALDGTTEYVVERDRPLIEGHPRSQWAQYTTVRVVR